MQVALLGRNLTAHFRLLHLHHMLMKECKASTTCQNSTPSFNVPRLGQCTCYPRVCKLMRSALLTILHLVIKATRYTSQSSSAKGCCHICSTSAGPGALLQQGIFDCAPSTAHAAPGMPSAAFASERPCGAPSWPRSVSPARAPFCRTGASSLWITIKQIRGCIKRIGVRIQMCEVAD